jgi:transformation/transcription domain-associated protein
VKTMSLVTYLLRGYSDNMKTFERNIVESAIHLLRRCPEDSLNSRKELLVSMRHILASESKRAFVPHLDELLDEGIFLGPGQPAVLRGAAFSTLADFAQQFMKEHMNFLQVVKVVSMFSAVVHDRSVPVSMQGASVRLLFLLMERLQHHTDVR